MSESKWIVSNDSKDGIVRASTIKPRLDYAGEIMDGIMEVLVARRMALNGSNVELYRRCVGSKEILKGLEDNIRCELEVSYAIESLRQVRRGFDSIVGLGNVATMLSPAISIVRIVRSRMHSVIPSLDYKLGDLSVLLSGIIVDAAHLAGLTLDFGHANDESRLLLDEAKLIADSKLCKQFPNLDFL